MNQRQQDCPESWVEETFQSPWQAFATLFGAMAILVAAYLGVHTVRVQPKVPWDAAIRLPHDGRFQPRLQRAVLERFFSESELTRLKDILTQRCSEAREDTLTKRRALFRETQRFLQHTFSPTGYTDRPALPGRFGAAAPVASRDAFRTVTNFRAVTEGWTSSANAWGLLELDAGEWTDDEVLIHSVGDVAAALRQALLQMSPGSRESGGLLVARLQHQARQEASLREDITTEIRTLEPPLNFVWLYHPGAGWIFEVVFWTWFGVLANSIITVILECKKNNYKPGLFALVIPKFFLAPLLSVVFVALWAAGITKSEVTFLSLPWFMAFAFFLGFMTESLYARLRKFADAIFGMATESSGQLPSGPGRDYHAWRHPLVQVKDLVKPATLVQLKETLKTVAQGEVERAIVEGKARETPP